MKQKQIVTVAAAKDAAQLILGGITEVGAAITLSYNTQADINTDLVNTIMACGNHEQAKQVKATRRNALVDAINESQKFIRFTRDALKAVFGTQYSSLWTVLCFQGSLVIPDAVEDVKDILNAIKLYLTQNPGQELGTVMTAARAQALLDALLAAQQALVAQEVTIGTLMEVRDAKVETLKKRISSVYQELRMQLGPLDQRWGNFGFNMPGADETPEQVGNVQVALLGPTAAAVKWPATVRAAFFHVWKKVIGVDAEPVSVGSPADLDFTIENLPPNSQIEISVSAVNNGGEGPMSEKITITTHS